MKNTKKLFENYAVKKHQIGSHQLDRYQKQLLKSMTHTVIEERSQNFREIDVFSRLIMDRIVFLGQEVNDPVANIVVAQLLFLESVAPKEKITLYLNSPGGSVSAGLSIYDTMQYVEPPVSTICTGLAASMGAVILCGGEKGARAALPHAKVMIHQPLGRAQGQISDMLITVNEALRVKRELYKILSKHTNQSQATIEKDGERDCWMSAEEAQKYGMIDRILTKKTKNIK